MNPFDQYLYSSLDFLRGNPGSYAAELERVKAALARLLRAFEADAEKCPGMTIKTSYETNSAAIQEAKSCLP